MFKVGDTVRLKPLSFYYPPLSTGSIYEVDYVGPTRISLKGIKRGHYLFDEFEIVGAKKEGVKDV